MILPFSDRTEAGRALGDALQEYRGDEGTLVLALVRGGVVIGRALADALSLPLFPFVVRKLGHPAHREFALGAIAEGGATQLDETTMKTHGVSWTDMETVIEEEMRELKRRKEVYGIAKRPNLKGKIILLTDDGAATGATLFAAIEDLRNTEVAKIIVALPVCPPDTAAKLKEAADEAMILATPADFCAVGQWYRDFPQVEDEEVQALLSSS